MKATVLRGFKDMHTGEEIRAGRIIDVTEERAKEIIKNLGAGAILAPDLIESAPTPKEGKVEIPPKPKARRKKAAEEG